MLNQKENNILINPILTNLNFKKEIFEGKIIKLTNSNISKKLVKYATQFLEENLNVKNPQHFEHSIPSNEFHTILSKLKLIFSNLAITKECIFLLLRELNFNLHTNYFDYLRLRAITSYAHKIKEAMPAFAIHRDTWYANSQSQINWWIPIYDVDEQDTFAFYPSYFSKPIKNTSNEFDYGKWKLYGGFQSTEPSSFRIFPEAKEKISKTKELKIPCIAGDILVFSASQLHGTTSNLSNKTRFSMDFRTLDLEDIDSNFAVNVDNCSTGSILDDMLSVKQYVNSEFAK